MVVSSPSSIGGKNPRECLLRSNSVLAFFVVAAFLVAVVVFLVVVLAFLVVYPKGTKKKDFLLLNKCEQLNLNTNRPNQIGLFCCGHLFGCGHFLGGCGHFLGGGFLSGRF